MKTRNPRATGPQGGLQAGPQARRGWRWSRGGALVSAPVRCRRDQWYLARARFIEPGRSSCPPLLVRFHHADRTYSERTLTLRPPAANGQPAECFGWIETPEDATHLELRLPDPAAFGGVAEIVFYPVAERDPKCHPLARVPRWSTYQPPFPLDRVVLPPSLESLAALLPEQQVEIVRPRTKAELVRAVRGAAAVLAPDWIAAGGWSWEDLWRLAHEAWLVVDLEALAGLLRSAGLEGLEVVRHESAHGIMSARVEYADVPTRGFALQDVFPYATLTPDGGFALRVLPARRRWKRFADRHGFAPLLASETPWPDRCGDVLSAALPAGRGELLATDLPWLVAGCFGPLLAPHLARHALRMHLGAPLDDRLQYWNRWDDSRIVVRDISDLARRYPPLRAVRWASAKGSPAHLGVALPALDAAPAKTTLVVRTGRIDNLAPHPGLPPEPLIIFMKMMAREWTERTAWARRHLRDVTVVWQFDTAAGLRYAANYGSAAPVLTGRVQQVTLARGAAPPAAGSAARKVRWIDLDEGLFGDLAFETLARLDVELRGLIASAAARR